MKIRRSGAVGAAAAATLATILGAGADRASAAHFYPSASLGTPWSDTTLWTATTGSFVFKHPTSGATLGQCTGSQLAGKVGGSGTRLEVNSASFSGCVVAGAPVFITPGVSSPWQIVPGTGSGLSWPTVLQDTRLTIRCGSPTAAPATYSGALASDATGAVDWQNVAASPSRLVISSGAALARTAGLGCPMLPATMRVTATLMPTSVGGAGMSPTNDLWVGP
jgi:hypothetical protein